MGVNNVSRIIIVYGHDGEHDKQGLIWGAQKSPCSHVRKFSISY